MAIVKVFIKVVRSNQVGDQHTTYEGIVGVGYTKTEANRMAFNQIKMRRDSLEHSNRYLEIHQYDAKDLKFLAEIWQERIKKQWKAMGSLLNAGQ